MQVPGTDGVTDGLYTMNAGTHDGARGFVCVSGVRQWEYGGIFYQ